MMTKEGSHKIVNFMTPGAGVLVLQPNIGLTVSVLSSWLSVETESRWEEKNSERV